MLANFIITGGSSLEDSFRRRRRYNRLSAARLRRRWRRDVGRSYFRLLLLSTATEALAIATASEATQMDSLEEGKRRLASFVAKASASAVSSSVRVGAADCREMGTKAKRRLSLRSLFWISLKFTPFPRKASSGKKDATVEHENARFQAVASAGGRDLLKQENFPKYTEEKSCSTSSPSSTLLEKDIFQVHTSELNKQHTKHPDEIPRKDVHSSHGANAQFKEGLQSSSQQEVKIVGLDKSTSTFPSKDPIEKPSPHISGTNPGSDNDAQIGIKESPPVQLMGRYDVPDPNRIPASIFTRTTTSQLEWSVASNESLFSIQLGKSGDLTGLHGSQMDVCPSKSFGPESVQPTIESELKDAETIKNVVKPIAEEKSMRQKPIIAEHISHSDSASQFSDGGSVRSFAFPILTEERNGSLAGDLVHPVPRKDELPNSPTQSKIPKAETAPKVESPKAEPIAAHRTWFAWPSCFSHFTLHCCRGLR
ncbi:uncharacterized protein LOC121995631 isoform X1 [Zingiber officinale]|uniref:uncharacterized protein LOC121995631 isoform X1 n=1 Tax=Zingiber officinale TaxID=94328 RepID=UPI001C4CBD5B|nr:uncharacterized protein LOC121995631 isoform X1 [Zingiber officinale]